MPSIEAGGEQTEGEQAKGEQNWESLWCIQSWCLAAWWRWLPCRWTLGVPSGTNGDSGHDCEAGTIHYGQGWFYFGGKHMGKKGMVDYIGSSFDE